MPYDISLAVMTYLALLWFGWIAVLFAVRLIQGVLLV